MSRRCLVAAVIAFQAYGPAMQLAAAGSASAVIQVTAQLVVPGAAGAADLTGATPRCRVAGEPLSLACGSPRTPTYLETRPDLSGMVAEDGWLTRESRTDAYGSVYAASLTTRLVRYEQWEYVETLVSW